MQVELHWRAGKTEGLPCFPASWASRDAPVITGQKQHLAPSRWACPMGIPAHECQCAAATLCRPLPPAEYPVRSPAAPHVSTSCQHQRLCMPFVRPPALHQLDRPQPTATALTLAEGSMRWSPVRQPWATARRRDRALPRLEKQQDEQIVFGRAHASMWRARSCSRYARVGLAVLQRFTEQHHPFRPAVPQPCLHLRTRRLRAPLPRPQLPISSPLLNLLSYMTCPRADLSLPALPVLPGAETTGNGPAATKRQSGQLPASLVLHPQLDLR